MTEIPATTLQPRARFLADHAGKPSSMRLMNVLSLLTAIFLAVVQAFQFGAGADESRLVGIFLLAAFAPKVLQAGVERFIGTTP